MSVIIWTNGHLVSGAVCPLVGGGMAAVARQDAGLPSGTTPPLTVSFRRSPDGGATWPDEAPYGVVTVGSITGTGTIYYVNLQIFQEIMDGHIGLKVYARTDLGKDFLWKSLDLGRTWTAL